MKRQKCHESFSWWNLWCERWKRPGALEIRSQINFQLSCSFSLRLSQVYMREHLLVNCFWNNTIKKGVRKHVPETQKSCLSLWSGPTTFLLLLVLLVKVYSSALIFPRPCPRLYTHHPELKPSGRPRPGGGGGGGCAAMWDITDL